MARRKAVVRRLSVVESLGSVDTICTDKTGTLTQNLMTLEQLFIGGELLPLRQDLHANPAALELLQAGILCNEATLTEGSGDGIQGDPVDTALVKAAQASGLDLEQERKSAPRLDGIPFSSERKLMTSIHSRGESGSLSPRERPARCWRSPLPAGKGRWITPLPTSAARRCAPR